MKPIDKHATMLENNPKATYPRLVVGTKAQAIRTRCKNCGEAILADIRYPSRPVGVYQVDCSQCGTPMIMGLV